MNIKINDTTAAISDSEVILSACNTFESLVSTLSSIKTNFESSWDDSTGQSTDRNSIIKSLGDSISYYQNKIIPALSKLGHGVNAYAIATEQIASASASNPGLANVTPTQFSDMMVKDESSESRGADYFAEFERTKIGDRNDPQYAEKWATFDKTIEFFRSKGLSDEQIAGICGNAAAESGFNPNAKNPNSSAKGLFQWMDRVSQWTGEQNQPSDWSVEAQLDHAWYQMQNRRDMQGVSVLEHLNNHQDNVNGAVHSFYTFFEGGGPEQYGTRSSYADAAYYYIKNVYSESINL